MSFVSKSYKSTPKPLKSTVLFVVCAAQILSVASIQADVNASKQQHNRTLPPVDFGVDTGIVRSATTLFREPSVHATAMTTLHAGALTILVSREQINGWFNVIEYSSGHQGWVKAQALVTHYTHNRTTGARLRSELTGGVAPPELNVVNATGRGMYIHLDTSSETYIAPYTSKKIVVLAGIHTYNAASPSVVPDFGSCDFLTGGRYSWTFTIAHAHQPKNSNHISQGTVDESKKLQADVDARTLEIKVVKQQIDDDRSVLKQKQNKWKSDSDILDAMRQGLDRTNQVAIDKFNSFVEVVNNELTALQQEEQRFDTEVAAYNSNLDLLNREKHRLKEIADIINAP